MANTRLFHDKFFGRGAATLLTGNKVVLCAHLGRFDEAREWLRRRLELQPNLTAAVWMARGGAMKFASPQILALFEEGLRKAGLPEE